MNCLDCQQPLPKALLLGRPREYCNDLCRSRYQNRRNLEGAQIRDLALYWRSSRKREALSALCHVVDNLLAADRAAGRPKPKKPELVRAKSHVALGTDRMPRQPWMTRIAK